MRPLFSCFPKLYNHFQIAFTTFFLYFFCSRRFQTVRSSLPSFLRILASSATAFFRSLVVGMWCRTAMQLATCCEAVWSGILRMLPSRKRGLSLCFENCFFASFMRVFELSIPVYFGSFFVINLKKRPFPHPMSAIFVFFAISFSKITNSPQMF